MAIMAIQNLTQQTDYDQIKGELESSLSLPANYFDDVVSVLMIVALRGLFTGNGHRAIQKNIEGVKNFFPVVIRNDYTDKLRYRLNAKVGSNDGYIILRYALQNGSEYAHITFEDSALVFRNTLTEGDKIIFIKKKNSDVYELFKIDKSDTNFTYSEDFFTINESNIKLDKTFFAPPIIETAIQSDNEVPNRILYGPPGTGKTRELNIKYLAGKGEESKTFVTFHQAYSYEEFIEGIKPQIGETSGEISYEYSNGSFFRACEAASKLAGYESLQICIDDKPEDRQQKMQKAIEENKIFCFCIDEINRANVAGVFGDLITLIETGKRLGRSEEMIVSLPYSKRKFGVPANLQIVGTMNTADRSITLIDTALRRRFEFIELAPDSQVFKDLNIEIVDIDLTKLLDTINERIEHFLGKDQRIGHAYFIKLKDVASPKKELVNIFLKKIIPLLEEYFYNDYESIRLVLGDDNPQKTKEQRFFNLKQSQNPFFRENDLIDEEKSLYIANERISSSLDEDDIDEKIFTLIYHKDETVSD